MSEEIKENKNPEVPAEEVESKTVEEKTEEKVEEAAEKVEDKKVEEVKTEPKEEEKVEAVEKVKEEPKEVVEEKADLVEAPVAEEKKETEEAKPEVKPEEAAAPPEFDWDSVGKKQENYTSDERLKLEGLYDNTLKSITEHEVLDGNVVSMNNREVVVNIGYKSDGVIPLNELRYNPDIKVGDAIEVYVENQ